MFNPFYLFHLLFDHKIEFEMQQRVLRTKDRSLALANISSVEISRFPLTPLVVLLLLPGAVMLFSVLGTFFSIYALMGNNSGAMGSFMVGAVITLLISALLIFLFFFFKKRRSYYLLISSNDGSVTFFRNRDYVFLTEVKTAIDDKINNDRIEQTFYANFAEGAVQSLNVESFETDSLMAETVVANSPGSQIANHSPGAQVGTGNEMKDNNIFTTDYRPAAEKVDENGEKPWYEKMLDVPLEKTSDFLSGLKNSEPAKPAPIDEISEPVTRDISGDVVADAPFAPPPPERGAPVGEGFEAPPRPMAGPPPGQPPVNGVMDKSGFPPNGAPGQMVANHSPGAQIGGHNQMNGNLILTDYRSHIPKVETIRRELTDPQMTEKLDEMIALMKTGTPQVEDKRRLKDYAMELAAYVQAYPPITKIFHDIVHAVGI